jgi:hypothetical protein
MSYVIQNYYISNTASRLTYRKYYNWLYRNTGLILSLTLRLFHQVSGQLKFNTLNFFNTNALKLFFCDGLLKLFTKSSIKWRPLLESQYIRSAEYWAYQLNTSLLENKTINPPFIGYSRSYTLNQYFIEKKYAGISIHNKYYRTVLVHFVRLVISNWQVWRPQFRVCLKFILINYNYHAFRFFNTRFFQIHSV